MSPGLQKVHLSFEDPGLTHFGGMLLFQQFCRKLDLKRYLQNYISWDRRTSLYHPAEMILALAYTMVAGMKRVPDTRILQYNGYFQDLLGIGSFPDSSTLRRFLRSISYRELQGIVRLHDSLRLKVWPKLGAPGSLILDVDSTVLGLFGFTIQGAKVGYHPRYPGRPSYHPLLCFEGHTRSLWHGTLREGNTSALSGIKEFWQACQKKFPAGMYRIRVRADAGLFSHQFIEMLEENGAGYVIVAKMTRPVQEKIRQMRYKNFLGHWQSAQFYYQPQGWSQAHRFIVIRRPQADNDQDQQLTLWQLKNYWYHVLVTDLPLTPPAAWRFYCQRARCELDIRELKEGFPLGKIPSQNFLANQAHFHLILLAYDLVNWFKILCLPEAWQPMTLPTIRTDLLGVVARLVYSSGRNELKLPPRYTHRNVFRQALRKVEKLKI